ncbi:unnamed protein product [Schistosoma curassoni]|uniref:Uncharacterized protein n=1 Tax=Schistosoma curassoni TaxID=6186 RepID=A0A183K2Y2_9TREM|nr:unnamed protein product [Schistosoma curassoni]
MYNCSIHSDLQSLIRFFYGNVMFFFVFQWIIIDCYDDRFQ